MSDAEAIGIGEDTERTSAADRAYVTLRRMILEGGFGPGDRLTGARLSSLLELSRTPIRAALLRLETEGLVETEDGRSARVRSLTIREVQQAYDVAAGLEGAAVHRLAQDATEDEIDRISDAVTEMEAAAAAGDREAWVAGDERFHRLIAELTRNPMLVQMMERVETIVGRLRFLSLHLNPGGAESSAHDHRAVVDAMRAHAAEDARSMHQNHWERVRDANSLFLDEGFSRGAGYLFRR